LIENKFPEINKYRPAKSVTGRANLEIKIIILTPFAEVIRNLVFNKKTRVEKIMPKHIQYLDRNSQIFVQVCPFLALLFGEQT
jgi:hypothetical protein